MKTKQFVSGALAAAVMAGGAMMSTGAHAELSASAGVASMYLWRGQDLGDGSAAVSGDLTYSIAGAYAGVWASSGDSSAGSEYDLYAGYGLELGPVALDLSVWNYNYSDGGARDDTATELSEVILGVSVAGLTLNIYDNVAGASNYNYYTLGYGMGPVSATLGYATDEGSDSDADGVTGTVNADWEYDYTHLDLTYAFNDNLSFTISKIIDESVDAELNGMDLDIDDIQDDDLKVVVSYSLDIK